MTADGSQPHFHDPSSSSTLYAVEHAHLSIWRSALTLLAYLSITTILIYQIAPYLHTRSAARVAVLFRRALDMVSTRLSSLVGHSYPSLNRALNHGPELDRLGTVAAGGDALKRAFGLGHTTLVSRLKGSSGGQANNTQGRNVRTGYPPGLGNWDNSCYQNSVIQGFASLPSIFTYLDQFVIPQSSEEQPQQEDGSLSTMKALRKIIDDLNNPRNSGRVLWTPSALKSMSSWQQQDAQEYFSKVVEELDREISQAIGRQRRSSNPGLEAVVSVVEVDDQSDKTAPQKLSSDKQDARLSSRSPSRQTEVTAQLHMHNPLEGLLAQRVRCVQCGWSEGLSMIPFICLTLPLGRAWSYDLEACLDEYTKVDHIEGVECARCTLIAYRKQLEQIMRASLGRSPETAPAGSASPVKDGQRLVTSRLEAVESAIENEEFSEKTLRDICKIGPRNRVSTTKTRQAVVARSPESLILHINRSVFDDFSGHQMKNYADVQFPKILDLASWCLRLDDHEDADHLDDARSQLREGGPLYEIRAVVTHYGRHENGHYICYRSWPYRRDDEENSTTDSRQRNEDGRSLLERQWWRLSDDDVCTVSEEEVLKQGGVFMLFYERIQQTTTKEPTLTGLVDIVEEEATRPEVVQSPGSSTPTLLADTSTSASSSSAQTPLLDEDGSTATSPQIHPAASFDPVVDSSASEHFSAATREDSLEAPPLSPVPPSLPPNSPSSQHHMAKLQQRYPSSSVELSGSSQDPSSSSSPVSSLIMAR